MTATTPARMTDEDMLRVIQGTGAYFLFFYAKSPEHADYWRAKVEEGTAGDCGDTWEVEYHLDEIRDLDDLREYNFHDVGEVVAIRGIRKNNYFF